MDVFGHEIDVSFVYQVEPVMVGQRDDAFLIYFKLHFKDGKEHKVEFNYNYTTLKRDGMTYALNIKTLNSRELKAVPKKFNDCLKKAKKMRDKIIGEMKK